MLDIFQSNGVTPSNVEILFEKHSIVVFLSERFYLSKKACHKTLSPYNAPSLTRREIQITK